VGDAAPALSALLVVADQRERARLSLQSLLGQSLIDRMEIVLLDCSRPGTRPVPGSEHYCVRQVRLGPGRAAGWIRAEAVRQARAPLVVFLEEHCLAFPGWAEAIVRAFEGPWAAVGPEMHNGNAGAGINRFLGILNYPLLLAPAIVEPNIIPHHNAAYRRDLLMQYGERLEVLMFPEDWLQLQMIADGHRLLLDPNMKVLHFFETTFRQSFYFNLLAGWAFEAACNEFYKRSAWARLRRSCALLLSTPRRLARQFRFILTRRRSWLASFSQGLPIMTALHAAHALGGLVGVSYGMSRDLPIRFLEAQINVPRALPDAPMGEMRN
jgi:hypothetical protein